MVLKLERKTHNLTNKQMSPNVWTLNIQTGNRGDVKMFHKFHTNCLNVWVLLRSPLWTMFVLHATLSSGLKLCLSLADVLSRARIGMTKLYCLKTSGGLLFGSRVKQRRECLSSMAGCTVREEWRAWKPHSPWSVRSMDSTRQIKAPTLCLTYPTACYTEALLLMSNSLSITTNPHMHKYKLTGKLHWSAGELGDIWQLQSNL